MGFKYKWNHNEANFGKPLKSQVAGGSHITLELILKYKSKFIALRRESIPGHESPHSKKNMLFFCHGLIRYGESIDQAVKRLVKEQCGSIIESHQVVYIESLLQKKDKQWAFTPHILVNLKRLPKAGIYGNEIKEVIEFTKKSIPDNFAWWTKKDLQEFLSQYV